LGAKSVAYAHICGLEISALITRTTTGQMLDRNSMSPRRLQAVVMLLMLMIFNASGTLPHECSLNYNECFLLYMISVVPHCINAF
jgi:hypothetical protein